MAHRDGADDLLSVEILAFADCTVDLTIGQLAASVAPAQLKTLHELYVGFFNRIPEAAGLRYWIEQMKAGYKIDWVAGSFYDAGRALGVYDADMSHAQFITLVYANVLGRTGSSAPNAKEIGYWEAWLNAQHTGSMAQGAMVLQMLGDSHEYFTGHAEVGWVVDLLDHKAQVAQYFAIDQGISYLDAQSNIARGREIAAAITPDDVSAAIALIGVNDFVA